MPSAAKIKAVKNVNPDETIKREMKEVDKELKSAVTRFRAPQTVENPEGDALGTRFPRRIFADDSERDTYIEWKRNADEKVYGQKRLEKEDFEYEKFKAQNQQYAQWLNWAETYFDMKDPAQQRIVEQLMPEYFETREKQIQEVADLQTKIAQLRLRGPRSKEDLFLIWEIYSGKLQVPGGAIWAPEEWYRGRDGNNLNRGLFNPHRYVDQAGRPALKDRWEIGVGRNGQNRPHFGNFVVSADGESTRDVFQGLDAVRR